MNERNEQNFRPEDFGIGRLFRHVRDAVIVANARTERIVLWNTFAETLFAYSEDEALQMELHRLVPDDLRDTHRAGIARYQETGTGNLIEGAYPVELAALHKNGHEIPIELTLTVIPERAADGSRFVMAIVRDISERKAAEQANLRMREVEHDHQRALELNDTVVQGLAVAKMALETGDHQKGLEAVARTMKDAQRIVTNLLDAMAERGGGLQPGDLTRSDPGSKDR